MEGLWRRMLSGHRKRSRKFLLYEKSVTSIRIWSLTNWAAETWCPGHNQFQKWTEKQNTGGSGRFTWCQYYSIKRSSDTSHWMDRRVFSVFLPGRLVTKCRKCESRFECEQQWKRESETPKQLEQRNEKHRLISSRHTYTVSEPELSAFDLLKR